MKILIKTHYFELYVGDILSVSHKYSDVPGVGKLC